MKKFFFIISLALILFVGCDEQNKTSKNIIKFGICIDYPPFESKQKDIYIGLDIDLAKLIAAKMQKQAMFVEMDFNAIFLALQSGIVDAGISAISSSDEREKNFSFSIPYYYGDIAILFLADNPLTNLSLLKDHKIAVQLGTVHEKWAQKYIPNADLQLKKSTMHSVESLKANHVSAVILDAPQAELFAQKNKGLAFKKIDKDETGLSIAFKKDSPLKPEFDKIIFELKQKGEIEKLISKHINNSNDE